MNKIIRITSTGLILASLTACNDTEQQTDIQDNLKVDSQKVGIFAEYPIFTRNIEYGSYKPDTIQAMVINQAVDTYKHPHVTGLVEEYYPAMLWFDSQLSSFKKAQLDHGVIGSPASNWACIYFGKTELGIDCRLETEFKVDNGVHGQGGPYLITTQMILSPMSPTNFVKGDKISFSGEVAGFDFSHKTEFKKMTLDSLGGNTIQYVIKDSVITKIE